MAGLAGRQGAKTQQLPTLGAPHAHQKGTRQGGSVHHCHCVIPDFRRIRKIRRFKGEIGMIGRDLFRKKN